MSVQNWNSVLNRVLAVQNAEKDMAAVEQRLFAARVQLSQSIDRDGLEFIDNQTILEFVIGDREYRVCLPQHSYEPATVIERALNVITLNK